MKGKEVLYYVAGTGVLVGLGYVGYRLVRRAIRDARQVAAENRAGADPASAASKAQQLRQAMNPSGISWMRSFDTTDEEAIYTIALGIRHRREYDEISREYRRLYGATLQDDLKDELESEEYGKFLRIIESKPLSGPGQPPAHMRGWVVFTQLPTVVYLPNGKPVQQVPAGVILGRFTRDEGIGMLFTTIDNQTRWAKRATTTLKLNGYGRRNGH
ncbi:MAG: hypothetical protein KF690_11060 [Bacteroidetes bacterium]|nr:hypothetical protein [Bacteroidota bacterium]